MASKAFTSLTSFSLSSTPKTAVVIGATTGIGAAVACRLASMGCKRVFVFGRNEARGEQVMERIKKLGEGVEVGFVKGDLSDVKGIKAAVKAIEKTVGSNGIDYLFQCQNGVPTGIFTPNSDGLDSGFVVQALSRFGLSYLLIKSGTLNPNAVLTTIANPGLTLDSLQVEDLSLEELSKKRGKVGLFMDQSARDSAVLDGFIEELHTRYPQYRYLHIHPGLVKSELFTLDAFPFPLNWLVWSGLHTFASTPESFANVPVYLTVHPAAKEEYGEKRYFDHKLGEKQLGKWASDETNRNELWKKLCEMIGEPEQ